MTSKTPCLVFRAATHWYAIPAAQVVNVSGPARPVRVPGTPPFIRGVIPITGKVVPVLALAPLLGESEVGTQVTRLVLVQDGARLAACEVAEVHGIEELDDDRPGPVAGAVAGGAAASAPHPVGERLVTRLEANRLMDLVAGAVRENG
jgi:purine-binding chemotaxis protein CheW